MNMPQGYNYKLIGEADTMSRSFNEIVKAIVLAVVVVYMVLAAQFESFSQPVIIMASLPFAVVGAVLGPFNGGADSQHDEYDWLYHAFGPCYQKSPFC